MRALLIAALCCAGCGDAGGGADAGAPDTISAAPLEVDVVAIPWERGIGVSAYFHEPNRPCECANDWPTMGTCAYITDAPSCDCSPAPGDCVSSFRIEANGVAIAEAAYRDLNELHLLVRTADLIPGRELELVLEGCGASARLPLATDGYPRVTVTDFAVDGSEAAVTWETEDAGTAVVAMCGSLCMQPFSGRSLLEYGRCGWSRQQSLTFLAGGGPIATPLGSVRLWQGTSVRSEEGILFPTPDATGRWSLTDGVITDPVPNASISMRVDGVDELGTMRVTQASFDPTADDLSASLILEGDIQLDDTDGRWTLSLTATPTADHVVLTPRGGPAYWANVPHVTPKDPLELGAFAPERYVTRIGPALLRVGFEELQLDELVIDWTIGVVPRLSLASRDPARLR